MFPLIGHCDIICFTPKISFDIRMIERYRQIESIQERAQTSKLFECVVRVGLCNITDSIENLQLAVKPLPVNMTFISIKYSIILLLCIQLN